VRSEIEAKKPRRSGDAGRVERESTPSALTPDASVDCMHIPARSLKIQVNATP
jgi:hypothetical protein